MKLVNFTIDGSNKVVTAFEVNKEGYKRMKDSNLILKDADNNKYVVVPNEDYLETTKIFLTISKDGKEVEPTITEIKEFDNDLKDDEIVKIYIINQDNDVVKTIEMQYQHIKGFKRKFLHSSRTKFEARVDNDKVDEAYSLLSMLKIVQEAGK